ncbi:hypothetical protein A1122_03325 [Yersinia pestis A1122]|nr:hypothetical protein A1122_03325 [Yersinia pestis A1122]
MSLMVVNSEIKQGMQSTCIPRPRQICHSSAEFSVWF